jgi:hypothetical protein
MLRPTIYPNHPHLDQVSVGIVQHSNLVLGLLDRNYFALGQKGLVAGGCDGRQCQPESKHESGSCISHFNSP